MGQRFSLYLPDELYERARRVIPDNVSWSSLFAQKVVEECKRREAAGDGDDVHTAAGGE